MLTLVPLTPQQSLKDGMIRFRPPEKDFQQFKIALENLLQNIDEADRENRQEIYVRDFLRTGVYGEINEVNKKGGIDLAIHLGKSKEDKVGVIIEAKRPKSGEMLTLANPNAKALQQAILYFLQERIDENNIDLKRIIITNNIEWFIFDAADFNRLFYENARFRRNYEEWRDGQKVGRKTSDFYEIAAEFIRETDGKIECTYFNLKDYELGAHHPPANAGGTDIRSRPPVNAGGGGTYKSVPPALAGGSGAQHPPPADNSADLIALYKIFSPYHLLKKPFEQDSNRLDKNFYVELLHIIGLEEIKEKNKTLIRRKAERARDAGSLLEKAIARLEDEFSIFPAEQINLYGANKEEQIFNIALELCIVWTNRILFLKLLESQLLNYHENNADYRFLDAAKVNDFAELARLFHDVLNKTVSQRDAATQAKYANVPYLNSSLFDFSETEKATIRVRALDNNIKLRVLPQGILRRNKESQNELPTLEYLFRFLDAYDFASEGKEGLKPENRELINASVLGKVFEKINGYKDGSFYTPGFITMYMCRQAIRLAVVQKFKERYALDIETFDDLYTYISRFTKTEKTLEFNGVINELKVCDPAVGSGHFLVSALNELLAIKSELGLLADAEGKPLSYAVTIVSDEIILTERRTNEPFSYRVRGGKALTDEMQRVQQTLFDEKQKIIENCLFGVDINPNSVKICRLRLWIELLKNAYYKHSVVNGSEPPALAGGAVTLNTPPILPTSRPPANAGGSDNAQLETLPNIDINIKTGNSLVSRFAIDQPFFNEAIKAQVDELKILVNDYKKAKTQEKRTAADNKIKEIKTNFKATLPDNTTKLKSERDKKIETLKENQNVLFTARNEAEKESFNKRVNAEIAKIESQIAAIDEEYRTAFEWRFEFPEVLDGDGNFTGFDAVIGNPPYIRQEEIGATLKNTLKQKYAVFAGTADLLIYFYELGINVLKPQGAFSFITSNKFMRAGYGKALRAFLGEYELREIIDFGELPVFEEAATFPVIVGLSKISADKQVSFTQIKSLKFESLDKVIINSGVVLSESAFAGDNWTLASDTNVKLIDKLKSKGTSLKEYLDVEINYGIKTGFNKAFVINEAERAGLINEDAKSAEIIFPFVVGDDIRKYYIKSGEPKFIIFTKRGIDIEQYPAIKKHLEQFKVKLTPGIEGGRKPGKYKWYEIQDTVAYYDDFTRPKIIYPVIAKESRFTLSAETLFANDKTFFIPNEDLFLLGYLNSKVAWFFLKNICSVLGDADKGGRLELRSIYVEKLPIPAASDEQRREIEGLVTLVIESKRGGGETATLEAEIDRLVYALYDLTDEERLVIEN